MRKILLTQGKFAIVDDENFGWLNKRNWYFSNHGYAVTTTSPHQYMHRMVNKTPKGSLTDHVNRNTLDNRRCNLRKADMSLNSINRPLQKNNTSGHKGLSWVDKLQKWETYICKDNKKILLGYFGLFEEAVLAREQAERKYHAI